MATGKQECLHCGKELTKKQVWRSCKYCSRVCFLNERWGEPVRYGKLLLRSKSFIEAVKLCQGGMTQVDAASLLGVHPLTVSGWFLDNNIVLSDRVCLYCGKPFTQTKYISNRKYCSNTCSNRASYDRKHPEGRQRRFDPELRIKGLEMYWGGLEGSVIAEHLGLPDGTVHFWIHKFGHLRKRQQNPEMIKLLPINLQLENARNPKEWQDILCKYAPNGEDSPIVMVCGSYRGNGGIDKLAMIVIDHLKCDPCDGMIYAFCSKYNKQISTICWQQGSFRLTKTLKVQGTYIWPKACVGARIKVLKNEFEYLLSLYKKRGKKSLFN